MADKGWVAIHRSIRDHWLYQEKRVFSKYEAWLDLLMDANHQSNKFVFDGKLVEVERGQKITSIRQLSEKWQWSRTKVTDFLNLLEKDGMLVRKSDSKKTVLTIVNYDFYQTQGNKKSHSSATEKPQKSTNNNDNNVNNENKEVVVVGESVDLQNVIQAYEQVFGMINGFTVQNLEHWCKDLSPELVVAALKESAEGNAYSFKYTESILRNWEKRNIKTLSDVESLNKERQNKRDAKQGNRLQNTGSSDYDNVGF